MTATCRARHHAPARRAARAGTRGVAPVVGR